MNYKNVEHRGRMKNCSPLEHDIDAVTDGSDSMEFLLLYFSKVMKMSSSIDKQRRNFTVP
jgi:hypothetical protein